MSIFKNFLSLSLVSSLLLSGFAIIAPQEAYAGTKNEVRAQCKRTKYTKGTWKLRIDAIDREEVAFGGNGTEIGSAFYILKFSNNGLVKNVGSAYDFHTGGEDVIVYPTVSGSAYSYMAVAKAESSSACQLGVSLLAEHYIDGSLVGAIDFTGVGYNDAYSLNPTKQGHVDLHNSIVYYYDVVDGWSGAKRAKASMTRLLDK
tara:strand:- start:3249 stop:3854 length:606 start_codon:yes stop_codon:yes gene_type:complete